MLETARILANAATSGPLPEVPDRFSNTLLERHSLVHAGDSVNPSDQHAFWHPPSEKHRPALAMQELLEVVLPQQLDVAQMTQPPHAASEQQILYPLK
jgi:hypothetical protein